MPYFKWTGVDITGNIKRGRLAAYSSEDLTERLFQRGISVIRSKPLWTISFFYRFTFSMKAQIFFAIARLLKAGIMIPDVFIITAQQSNNPLLYDALFAWTTDVKNGMPFSAATNEQYHLCDPLVITMLTIGYESGTIIPAVENVASYYHMRYMFKKNIHASLALPLLTLIFFIAITLFIFLFIMPRFSDMFLSINSELPILTRYMIRISSFVSSAAMMYCIVGCILLIAGMYYYIHHSGVKLWNMLCMKTPFIGRLLWNYECGQWLYALSLLLDSNSALLQSLELLESCSHNHIIKHYIHLLRADVQSGRLLSQAMSGILIFPSDVIALIKIGEESGTLSQSLVLAADLYRDSAQCMLNRLLLFVQPIFVIILGFLIGLLIFAVYLPIMNLSFSI